LWIPLKEIPLKGRLQLANADDDEASRLGRCSQYGITNRNKVVREHLVEVRGGMEAVPEQVGSCILTGVNAEWIAQKCSAAGISRLIKACKQKKCGARNKN
jgi:hypothetical protein